jgi:hypothetical protein
MTEAALWAGREVVVRACCGRLRWALLDAVESLPVGARVAALRWGPAEISVNVEVGAGEAAQAVDAIMAATQRQLGAGAFCYTGRGALVIDVPPQRRPADGAARRSVVAGGDAAMRLTVSRRVAGEAKCAATYIKFLEDLSRAGSRTSPPRRIRILQAGFLDYRMIRLNLDVPPPGDAWHAELAATQLRDELREGLGVDPRMLSGRLAVLVDLAEDGEEASGREETMVNLRGCGYTVTIDNG